MEIGSSTNGYSSPKVREGLKLEPFGSPKVRKGLALKPFFSGGKDAGAVRCPIENVFNVPPSPRRGPGDAVMTQFDKIEIGGGILASPTFEDPLGCRSRFLRF